MSRRQLVLSATDRQELVKLRDHARQPYLRERALVQYDFRDNCLNIINYLGLFAGSCGASRARVRLQS